MRGIIQRCRWLWVILAVKLLIGTVTVSQVPLWQGHEADFITVSRILRDRGRLPIPSDYPDGSIDSHNANQPILYYLLLHPMVLLFDNRASIPPDVQPLGICDNYNTNLTQYAFTADDVTFSGITAVGYLGRLLSLVLGCGAVALTYAAARRLFPDSTGVALVAGALLAFEPRMVQLNAEINNDNLLLFVSAAYVLALARLITARDRLRFHSVVLIGVSFVAIETKLHGWIMLAFAAAVIGFLIVRSQARRHPRRTMKWLGIGTLAITGAALLILLINQAQYGSMLGRYAWLDQRVSSTLHGISPSIAMSIAGLSLQATLDDYTASMTQAFPRAAVITAFRWIPLALMAILLISIALLILKRNRAALQTYAVLIGFILSITALVIFRGILTNADAGFVNTIGLFSPVRYYTPALPALALMMGASLVFVFGRVHPRLQRVGMLIPAIWLITSALWLRGDVQNSLLVAQSRLSVDSFVSITGIDQVDTAANPTPFDFPQIVGYHTQPAAATGLVDVTVYARALAPLRNLMMQISLRDARGHIHRCQFMPVGGLYATGRWPPNEIVRFTAQIPNCAADAVPPFTLEASWVPVRGSQLVMTDASVPVLLGTVDAAIGTARHCTSNLGIVDSDLQIIQNNSPEEAQRGTVYLPSVNWLSLDNTNRAVTRVYRLVNLQTGNQIECSGQPRQDTYPFSIWRYGEEIYFDECILRIPADAEPGIYSITVGVQDANGAWLPITAPGGGSDNTFITVGQVHIF